MPGGAKSRTTPTRIAVAQRRAQAVKLRLAGMRYEDIATQLGYNSRGNAAQDVQRALAAEITEPAEELRAIEVQRLDMLWNTAMKVLTRLHVSISNGKVVHLDGTPVRDDGPVLAAIDRLLKIQERRAKLLGLDAPKQFEVVSLDAVEQEIRRLNAELDAADQAAHTADLEPDETGAAAGAETAPGRG